MEYRMEKRMVTVTIDRKLGTKHPKFDMIYPINYGYIEGIIGGDGEEQDAYIVGVDIPVDSFYGEVIAVVERFDDCEEKWVVAKAGSKYTEAELENILEFQEKYFHHKIHMI